VRRDDRAKRNGRGGGPEKKTKTQKTQHKNEEVKKDEGDGHKQGGGGGNNSERLGRTGDMKAKNHNLRGGGPHWGSFFSYSLLTENLGCK